jgi:hypothetical protein
MQYPQHPYTRLLWAAAHRHELPENSISDAAGSGLRITAAGEAATALSARMTRVADDHYVAATD